jgi:hypothetical protein
LSLREDMQAAVTGGDLDAIDALAAEHPRAVRYLVGLMYRSDDGVRRIGARGIALAARHHPRVVKKIIERLLWAMNVESNTYAPAAPEVLLAIAEETPELLVPVVSDLVRLSKDAHLSQGLGDTLRRIAERCPGEVGRELTRSLNRHAGPSGRGCR